MDDLQTQTFEAKPGQDIVIKNEGPLPLRYRIDFGEYGSMEVELLVGSEMVLKCGTKPPVINVMKSDVEQGIYPIDS